MNGTLLQVIGPVVDVEFPEGELPKILDAVVVALVASFARVVVPAVKEAGFRVAATLPESCAVARLFADRDEPILLV